MSNWLGFALHIALTFLLTPFVLDRLGEARYGIWALVAGLTGYYGLLDMGFRAGLTQCLCRRLGERDNEGLNRLASSGAAVLMVMAGALLAASFMLAAFAPQWFAVSEELRGEVRLTIVIVGASAAVQFMFFPFSAAINAAQRFDVSNAIGAATRLGGALAVFLLLSNGFGLVGLAAATAGANVLDYVLRWRTAYWCLPQLEVSFRHVSRSLLGEVVYLGFWNMLSAASVRIISYSDAIVIGLFFPSAAIARFVLALRLAEYFSEAFSPVAQVFFPVFSQLDAEGDAAQARSVYLHGSRFTATLAVNVALLAWLWADDFYRLWIGSAAAASAELPAVAPLFQVLLLAAAVTAVRRIGTQVLLGARRVRTVALLFAAEAVANLSLSVGLMPWFGLKAVALGTAIPTIVFQGVVQPLVVGRLLGITFVEYLRSTFARPAAAALCAAPLLAAIRTMAVAGDWLSFSLQAAAACCVSAGVIVLIGLDAAERRRFVVRPLLQLAGVSAAPLRVLFSTTNSEE